MTQLPDGSVLIRTWFGDDEAWTRLVEKVQTPSEEGFLADVRFVDDREFEGMSVDQLVARHSGETAIAFIADEATLTQDDGPILAVWVAPSNKPFRVVASELWGVENNLPWNMDWSEFADAVDEDGVFRGFPADEPISGAAGSDDGPEVDDDAVELPHLPVATSMLSPAILEQDHFMGILTTSYDEEESDSGWPRPAVVQMMFPTPSADRTVPNLPSRDFSATTEFYGRFGFVERFRDDGWLILCRGDLELEFFPFPELDPWTSSFMCSVRVADVDELWNAVADSGVPVATAGIPRLTPVTMQPWGRRVGYLNDVDGTQLNLIENAGE